MYHLFVLMICILAEGGGIPRGCEAKGFAKIVREPVAPVAPVGKLDMGQQVTVVRFWVTVLTVVDILDTCRVAPKHYRILKGN